MNPNDGKLTLVIGNRNYSSWSLRVWLWMRQRGLVFDVVRVPLFDVQTDALLQGYFSDKKVPVLQHGERIIWDSLAILEYLNETFPHTKGWPEQAEERAIARSITAEMHSSFHALREALPMNCRRPVEPVEIDLAALPRSQSAAWPLAFRPYFHDSRCLLCPGRDASPYLCSTR
jgi:glutathione S-transferase